MRRVRRTRVSSVSRSVLLDSGILPGTSTRFSASIAFAALVCSCLWSPLAAGAVTARLPLHECRLEHPLRLASIPARCGVL